MGAFALQRALGMGLLVSEADVDDASVVPVVAPIVEVVSDGIKGGLMSKGGAPGGTLPGGKGVGWLAVAWLHKASIICWALSERCFLFPMIGIFKQNKINRQHNDTNITS